MIKNYRVKPVYLFYLLVAYALIQFSWWTFLLIKLNRSFLQFQSEHSLEPMDWEAAYYQKIWMISGEGLVFFLIMIWGIYQIQKSFKRELELAQLQKNFLLSVTHELKTPLASVRLGLETLQKHKLDELTRKKVIGQGIGEADRLNILIEKILFSTRLEDHGIILNPRDVNISILLRDTLETPMQTIGKDHNINIEIEDDIFAMVDEWAFKSIVINLFENALKYSQKGTNVKVVLEKENSEAKLCISDEGIGIAVMDRSKIYQRFVRLENEDTRSVKGTGLGLFIVKSLVDMHHARIKLEDNEPKGSRFIINFIR